MTVSIENLRDRLESRQVSLDNLRTRIQSAKAAKDPSHAPPPKASISDIQKRYLSAVAELDQKQDQLPKPVFSSSNSPVSSLASRWNKGIEKKVERTVLNVRGDVSAAKKRFSLDDFPKAGTTGTTTGTTAGTTTGTTPKKIADPGPAELLVEDDSDVPSWARNQKKVLLKKENARSSVRHVDLTQIRGSVMTPSSRDGAEAAPKEVVVGGTVKAALAMWGKNAEEDAKVLAMKTVEQEKKKTEQEKLRKEREEKDRKRKTMVAIAKFANLSLDNIGDEPKDEIELLAYLERKIYLIEKQIKEAEAELDKIAHDGQ